MRPVDLGELALERGVRGLLPAGGQLPAQRANSSAADQVRLQPRRSAARSRQQRPGAAAEIVAFERELVDPLEQHREALAGVEHRIERGQPGHRLVLPASPPARAASRQRARRRDGSRRSSISARSASARAGEGASTAIRSGAGPRARRARRTAAAMSCVLPVPAAPRIEQRDPGARGQRLPGRRGGRVAGCPRAFVRIRRGWPRLIGT